MADEFEVIRYPQINNINLFTVSIDYRTPHLHSDFEINLILKGKAVVLYGGNSYTIDNGSMILFNPNQPHEIKTIDEPANLLCLQFSPKLFKSALPQFESISFDTILPFENMPHDKKLEISRLFVELGIQYTRKISHYEILCMGFLNLMMYYFLATLPCHQVTREEQNATLKRVERLNRIIKYVDDNYTNKICLTDIARQEGLSLGYLSHFIKDNLNQTFQEYVGNIRFNQARKLLLAGNNRLLDICIASGFSDPRYLMKAFLKNTGMSPSAYRKQHENTLSENVHRSQHSSQLFYNPEETVEMLERFKQTDLNFI